MNIQLYLLLIFTLIISSCATADLSLSESAKEDYLKAERLIKDEQYSRATQYLGSYVAKHPYSTYATKAELLRIKSAYANNEYILSETLANRFISAHPNHPKRDYAEFMLGMSFYSQSESAEHEQVFSKKAKDTFSSLNQRNQNNAYAEEVREYIRNLTNRIAKHEVIIGKFYHERNLYIGAVNRFIIVKNNYYETDIAPESLYWLASSYLALQQQTYAKQVIQQLEKSFAGNEWQKKAETLM